MNYLDRYNFAELGLSPVEVRSLTRLQEFNVTTEAHLGTAIQFPEPSLTLDLESRKGDASREFNYLHQMSLLHATHFEMANKIKSTYLIDCYLWSAARLNPIGLYSAARSILELHAMLHFVRRSLVDAAAGPQAEWRNRGVRYFRAIIKARFGTTDPELQKLLIAQGLDEATVQPIRLTKARKLLTEELPWLEEQYATLCDYVHHNLLSQRVAGAFAGESAIARSGSGGQLILSESAPLIQYCFPMSEPGREAVKKTASRALENVKGMVAGLNGMLRTPYTEAELVQRTGSPLGLRSPRVVASRRKPPVLPSKNRPCPCGSGKKFKNCHGSSNSRS